MKRKMILLIIAALLIMALPGVSRAGDEDLWTTVITPDAVIIQDLTGSMAWIPNGSSPTLYACGNDCTYGGPFYVSPQLSGTPSTLYIVGDDCSGDGPYTVTKAAGGAMPTANLWVTGTNCSIDGPFSRTIGSNPLNLDDTNVYIPSSSSCGYNGPFYRDYSKKNPDRRKSCSVSTYLDDTVYTATNCTDGPFYNSSGSGHTTACYKYSQCAAFASGYTETDCTSGPFYRTSGSGHTTACVTSATCTRPAIVYTETNCTTALSTIHQAAGIQQYVETALNHAIHQEQLISTAILTPATVLSIIHPIAAPEEIAPNLKSPNDALFELLDYNADNSITSSDNTGLGMRLGLMRYYNCSVKIITRTTLNTDNPWDAGCIKLSWGITQSDFTTATPYANLYCNNTTCASTVTSCTTSIPQKECIAGYCTSGGTPLAYSIREAKRYLDYHKTLDSASTCRQKSIIVVTDGADTYACGGNGSVHRHFRKGDLPYTMRRRQPMPITKFTLWDSAPRCRMI